MKRTLIALTALAWMASPLIVDARGFSGGGGGLRGGGAAPADRGGFDMHAESPGGATHSSTGPGGTQRTPMRLKLRFSGSLSNQIGRSFPRSPIQSASRRAK